MKPADSFDLIRWLARTQSDPRKAVAEFVQNSIDAGAGHVWIERRRARGTRALAVLDDGQGVLPDMSRPEALRYIATHIGHSRKLNLTPSERAERVIAGKYGIGLLGFWAVGRRMEIRSRVGGGGTFVLRLVEDEPLVDLAEEAPRLDAPPTFTEVLVLDLHEPALRQLTGRKLADYLAAELRGPILQSGARVEVRDRLARGLSQQRFAVAPRAFLGEPLDLPREAPVEGGRPPIRLELHFAPGAERPAIQLACGGTLVADDLAHVAALGCDGPPWTGRGLSGVVDFPGFTVPPGTRRGVVPDAAAAAFAAVMRRLAPEVEAEIARLERARHAEVDRRLVDDLRRALRGLRNRLPAYDLPPVESGTERRSDGLASPGVALPVEPEAGPGDAGADGAPPEEVEEPLLFPPGPLAAVAISPAEVRLAPGSERRVTARATDEGGRLLARGVSFAWSIDRAAEAGVEVGLAVRGDGPRPALVAAAEVPLGTAARLFVRASQDGRSAEAAAAIAVEAVEPRPERGAEGIPEPELVDDPEGPWRSRYDGRRWRVNAGHEDYRGLRDDPRGRFRYLLSLLAKEIVQRSYGRPDTDEILERLVQVLAHAERNLRG